MEDLISLRVQCGLKLLGWATHIKISCMFASCAVFIRFMMVTKEDDIRMSSEHLRPHQASLEKIILIALILLSTCFTCTVGISIVNLDFGQIDSLFVKICLDDMIQSDKAARKKSEQGVLTNLSLLFVLLLFCSYNKIRVNSYIRSHGRSHFSHRRQNILTFRQLVRATYIYILIPMIDSILLILVRYIFTSVTLQQDYRHFLQVYFILETVALTAFLPLSWLISVWKNLPEFSTKEVTWIQRPSEGNSELWKKEVIFIQRPPKVNSELGYIKNSLKPRGPYSYAQDLSKLAKSPRSNDSHAPTTFVYMRKPIVHGRNNIFRSTHVPAKSKCVYLLEASDNNPPAVQSTLSILFYSSTVKTMPRTECPRQAKINVIHVKGHSTPDLEDNDSDIQVI